MQCGASTNCIVTFPSVPAASRLDVHFAACEVRSTVSSGQSVAGTRIYLQTNQNGKTISFGLAELNVPEQYGGGYYYSAVSQPVEFSVSGQQSLSIYAWPGWGGVPISFEPIDQISCTVNGDLADAGSPAPFQMTAHAQCPSGVDCVVKFPVSAGQTRVTFAACEIYSETEDTASETRFYLQTQQNGKSIGFPLASINGGGQSVDQNLVNVYSSVSQPVNFLVPAGQVLKVFAWPADGRYIDRMDCTIAGENLQ